MQARPLRPRPLLLAALAAVLLLLAPPTRPGRAQPEEDAPPEPARIVDLRILRVDLTDAAAARRGPWEDLEGATTLEPWEALEARLAPRGLVTLLLDQRATGMPGHPILIERLQQHWVRRFDRGDDNNQTTRGAPLLERVRAAITDHAETMLYDIEVETALEAGDGSEAAPLTVGWEGAYPRLAGETLVLHHAEQLPARDDQLRRGIEIHVFLRVRPAP